MNLVIYPRIRQKLEEKHGVTVEEVEQAFLNKEGRTLRDLRHTDPSAPRYWFIAETDAGGDSKLCLSLIERQARR